MKKPKGWPLEVVPISIDLYGKTIYFSPSLEAYNAAVRFMGREDVVKENSRHVGFMSTFEGKTQSGDDAYYYFVVVTDGAVETLVHELSHASLVMIERLGFSAHDGFGEPFCYLLDYLVQKTLPLLKAGE